MTSRALAVHKNRTASNLGLYAYEIPQRFRTVHLLRSSKSISIMILTSQLWIMWGSVEGSGAARTICKFFEMKNEQFNLDTILLSVLSRTNVRSFMHSTYTTYIHLNLTFIFLAFIIHSHSPFSSFFVFAGFNCSTNRHLARFTKLHKLKPCDKEKHRIAHEACASIRAGEKDRT